MSTSEKKRIAKEADYIKDNDDVKSVCPGVFYIKNKKAFETCKHCTKCHKFKEYNTVKDLDKRPEVKFYYVDSFRACQYYKYKPVDAEFITTSITYSMVYINDSACNYVKELDKAVRESQDKELQKKYGAAMKRVRSYFKMLYDVPQIQKNLDFLAEFNGCMDDVSDNCAENMENAIREFYQEMGIENYELLSKVEMARTMVEYSVRSLNKMITHGKKFDRNIVSLQVFRLEELYSIMEDVSNWAFRKVKSDINMSADLRIIKAYRDLNDKLINFEKVSECLMKAEELYGGFKE